MPTARDIKELGDQLFEKKRPLDSLHQEIAENFYPERADFTISHHLGDEFAEHLMSSFPVKVRRDLGNSFQAMLRPRNKEWASMRAVDEDRETNEAKRWLEEKTTVQFRAMYDRGAKLIRATKETDQDFAAFGQGAIHLRLNARRNGLLFRNFHIRDCAWKENAEGDIDTNHRKWKPTALMLKQLFGEDNLDDRVKQCLRSGGKKQFTEFNVRHVMMPAEEYKDDVRAPWVSLYIDCDNEKIIEESPSAHFEYVIPRWQTVSGSQYAHSPATIVGLPDGRLIQQMSLVLLEAGEKATNPPTIATKNAITSDVNLYAGGTTWVDYEYDERLGDALRPLTQNLSGMPIGLEMLQDLRAQLQEIFFIDQISGPPVMSKEATAFEIARLEQNFIRQAVPLFEPMEIEYNGALMESVFSLLMANGAFGSPQDIPRSLRGGDVEFRFESPLSEAIEREKGQKFVALQQALAQAVAVDPDTVAHVDIHTAFRDAISGIGTPAKWIQPEQTAAQTIQGLQQQRLAASMQQQAATAATVGKESAEADKFAAEAANAA